MNDFNRKWAAGLRSLILLKLRENGPQTTHELATACQVSQDAIAPRMTELEMIEGLVFDTGRRKSSASGRGRKLKVWEAIPTTGDYADRTAGADESSEPVMRLL